MGLEQCLTRGKFNKYTTNTPDTTWITPSMPQNNFRGSILSSRDNIAAILVMICRATKVD
uniref:Uncharacterized protein n=1 Tax=Arundo donax TaxID=35708 RepID=A0A0A9GQ43_ARUDO